MTPYSPTRVATFSRCEQLMALEDAGWRSTVWTPADSGKFLGHLWAEVTQKIHAHYQAQGSRPPDGEILDAALEAYSVALKDQPSMTEDIRGPIDDLTQAAIKYADEMDAIWSSYVMQRVEWEIPDSGASRLDVVANEKGNDGAWVIVDLKYKQTLKATFLPKTLAEYDSSWQLRHYAAHIRKLHGLDYAPRTAILLTIGKPYKTIWHEVVIRQADIDQWWKTAENWWGRIQEVKSGTRLPVWSASHYSQYGPCPFLAACLEYDADPQLMRDSGKYRQKEVRK